MVEYDREVHLPTQVETLIQLRANGELEKFKHILKGVEIIIKKNVDISNIEKQQAEEIQKCLRDATEILTKGTNAEETLKTLYERLIKLDNDYEALQLKYMDEVLETILDYKKDEA